MIEKNLELIFSTVKNGNNLGEEIAVVGASKTMSAEVINRAVSAGLKIVAENKVQEFREKTALINKACEQQFIGHLQTNKVKYLVGNVTLIHSVDSIHLAEEIDKEAKKKNFIQNILIEVNIGNEQSKSGFDFNKTADAVKDIAKNYSNLSVVGLMAMLPKTDDQNYLISLCKDMRKLFDTLKGEGLPFKYLSMGTSGDFKIAINNGSNMIRLGTTIFGERNYGEKNNGNI